MCPHNQSNCLVCLRDALRVVKGCWDSPDSPEFHDEHSCSFHPDADELEEHGVSR